MDEDRASLAAYGGLRIPICLNDDVIEVIFPPKFLVRSGKGPPDQPIIPRRCHIIAPAHIALDRVAWKIEASATPLIAPHINP